MTKIATNDVTISNQELARLLKLDDQALYREVKRDLKVALMQKFIALPLILVPNVRNSALFYGSLILADEVEAPSKIRFYLIKIKSQLEEWLCDDMQYCSNKEKVAKLIAEVNEAAAAIISEKALEEIKKLLNEYKKQLMGALFFKIPLSLLVYLLKKGLNLLCRCDA